MTPSNQKDPRSKNKVFDSSTASSYFQEYRTALFGAMEQISPELFERAATLLFEARSRGAQIFVIGNGGSAAIADHLSCDWTKGAYPQKSHSVATGEAQSLAFLTHSLCSNTPMLTAMANDFGFDQVFSRQIEMLGRRGDVLVAISSSGNSPNIINGAKKALQMGLDLICLTGFEGGTLSALAQDGPASSIHFHVPCSNYGVVEDTHQATMHVIGQFLAARIDHTSS